MYKKRITEKVETEAVVQRVMVEKWEYDDEECGYVFGHQVSADVQRRETHSFTGDNMLMGTESEASHSTEAAENILPILVMKDKRSKTLSASFMLANGVDGFVSCNKSVTRGS